MRDRDGDDYGDADVPDSITAGSDCDDDYPEYWDLCEFPGGSCSTWYTGYVYDCSMECVSSAEIGDGSCDDGSWTYEADFACSAFDYDEGDCEDECVDDNEGLALAYGDFYTCSMLADMGYCSAISGVAEYCCASCGG